jgi:hypothetical protein
MAVATKALRIAELRNDCELLAAWATIKEDIAAEAQRQNDAWADTDLLGAADGEGLVLQLWKEAKEARRNALAAHNLLLQYLSIAKVH